MQTVRYSSYKRNAFATAVRQGNIERVREIISSRDPSYTQEWSDAIDGYVLLITALQNKRTDIAKVLLTNGSEVNNNNKNACNTPLHYAVRNGDTEIVQMLLDRGANINIWSVKSKTALHIAVECKKMDIIGILLKHGASVKILDISDTTPLHTAVKNNSIEIVKLLLSSGANINATTSHRIGQDEGYLQIVWHLLDHGACVNSMYSSATRHNCTPLHLAAEIGAEEIIKLLLSKGANVNAQEKYGRTCSHIALEKGYLQIAEHLLKSGASVNAVYTSATRGCYTLLHLAAKIDAEEITKLLLSKGANVNAPGNDDITPLHVAAQAGYLNIVQHLLKNGANVDSTSRNGYTPLYLAVRNRHEKVVKLLVECGACVDAKDKNNRTILRLAVEKGISIIVEHILKPCPSLTNRSNSNVLNVAVRGCGKEYSKIVEDLLEYGFTVNPDGANSCMQAAVEKGYVNIVEGLLKRGTDVNTLYNPTSRKRYIPLHVATKNRQEEVAKLLISYGADVNAPDETGKSSIFYAIENGDLKFAKLLLANKANVKDNPELLNNAVTEDHREIVEVPLQYGADVNASDKYGRMPLHSNVLDKENKGFGSPAREGPRINTKEEVAKLLLSRGYVKVVEALLECDTDVNPTYKTRVTPLHLSAKRGNEVITKMLLNKGVNIHAKDARGETALHRATRKNHKEVVELLLKCGAKVDARTDSDLTPLHIAVEFGRLNIVELLLKFGAKVDSAIEYDGTTSLHSAAEFGHLEILKLLLKFDACVDSTDRNCLTALHTAAIKGREGIITALLEHGSDVTVKSKSHFTALDFALDGIQLFRDLNHTSEYDDAYNCDDHDISTYVNIAEILKRHVVKLKAASLIAENDDILSIKSDDEELIVSGYPTEYERKMLRVYSRTARKERRLSRNDFQIKCEEEIARMRSEKFINTNITFYDILKKDLSRLAMYARNESIVKACGSGNYKDKFPIYASMINNNFRKGEKRRMFLEQGNKIFDLLFNDFRGLPRDCTERIFSYLKDDDLRALTDAGEPIVHCQ